MCLVFSVTVHCLYCSTAHDYRVNIAIFFVFFFKSEILPFVVYTPNSPACCVVKGRDRNASADLRCDFRYWERQPVGGRKRLWHVVRAAPAVQLVLELHPQRRKKG